jgi:ERCC4-type nuclease
MLLKLDCRESKLIHILRSLINDYNNSNPTKHVTFETGNLHIGDAMIIDNTDCDNHKNIMVFERKTISDLASSISDGRYTEQSFRLDKAPVQYLNIIYLVDGDIRQYKGGGRINKNAIYSSMISLNTYKGFSLIRSFDVDETANIILQTLSKIIKNKAKSDFFYKNEDDVTNKLEKGNEYIDVIKMAKKTNINKDNINEIMLSQIPGVSVNVSKVVMQQYKTIKILIAELDTNPDCLTNMKMTDINGKERKINKSSIENIKIFLSN